MTQIDSHDAAPRKERDLVPGVHAHAPVVHFPYRAVKRTWRIRVHVPEMRFPPNPRIRYRCRVRHAVSLVARGHKPILPLRRPGGILMHLPDVAVGTQAALA
jgi:hypothetical protein